MITFTTGDIFEAQVDALVNPVNTVGVMGRGLALAFKTRYPRNFDLYKQACQNREVHAGRVLVTAHWQLTPSRGPRFIVNFPTKQHWRDPSQLVWIRDGLDDLVKAIRQLELTSIAIPALGAGLGGLPWPSVRELIEQKLAELTDVDVLVFEPGART